MTSPNDLEPLHRIWKALEGHGPRSGWSTLEVWRTPSARLMAGRWFPEGTEALLVGLHDFRIPPGIQLPAGRGFQLLRPELEELSEGADWLALVRRSAGGEELFSAVAEDVMSLLRSMEQATPRAIVTALVERVRAWQAFMERERPTRMSTEAELGLVGELLILEEMLDSDVMAEEAVQSWQGPLEALHDFQFPSGAFEVKTTTRSGSFPARIQSLDQLDHTLAPALFLAGVRVTHSEAGLTLPGIAARIRGRLLPGSLQAALDSRLIHAGLHPGMEEACTRRYAMVETEILEVKDGFPALTRAKAGSAITDAEYTIDLERVESPRIPLADVLRTLGVL